jgi:hypothetical protein
MFIYQVGDVVIRGFAEHSTPVEWKNEGLQNEFSSTVFYNSLYPLPEIASYSVSGTIAAHRGNTASRQLVDLMRNGGRPYIDIIGYLPNACCEVGSSCSICCGVSECVRWYHTYGRISSVERTYTLDESVSDPLASLEISFELEANPYWEPLNKYLYIPIYGDVIPNVFELEENGTPLDITLGVQEKVVGVTNLIHHPCQVAPFHYEPEFVWVKRRFVNSFLLYDTAYWDDWNDSSFVYAQSLSTSSLMRSYTVSSPHSGSVRTLHAFGHIEFGTGHDLVITVNSEYSPFNIIATTSTLNLEYLDDNLRSYGVANSVGLAATGLSTDIVLYSQNDVYPHSFMIKDGYPVYDSRTNELFIPKWDFSTRCPGELIGIRNKVDISFTLAWPTNEVGALHLHRVY